MPDQPFLIANTRVGMERDIEPWLLPTDAYPDLEDTYLWRGRIVRRYGYKLLGRLKRKIGTTDAGGNFTNALTPLPNFPMKPGASQFLVGANQYQDNGSAGNAQLLLTDGMGVANLDRSTGILIIAGSTALTDVIYVPGLPVMGLLTLENRLVNEETLVAFDTAFSYIFDGSVPPGTFIDFSFYKSPPAAANTIINWSASDANLFWYTNYQQAFWVTNNKPGFQNLETTQQASATFGDGIRWHGQTLTAADAWVNFLPQVDTANFLMGCLIILPYKGFLITLSTWEGPAFGAQQNFQQRARWNGPSLATPFYSLTPQNYSGGANINAWRSDIPGNGGFVDAPTAEAIVSAEFIKDTLIVYFERSTWQLRFTGISTLPFLWEKINTELGAESTFSVVPFDKTCIAIGNVGIHECDSVNVQRIDQKIPDEVFAIQNKNSGPERTFGVRDYFNQLVYWSFPYIGQVFFNDLPNPIYQFKFPNKLLVYNYIDGSFSFFNDAFTCFGYYQQSFDLQWQNDFTNWQDESRTWAVAQDQSQFPFVVGGNQQGFVEILMQQLGNAPSLLISQISFGLNTVTITSPDHNLTIGQFIKFSEASGTTGLVGNSFEVIDFPPPTADQFTVQTFNAPGGVFTGSGEIIVKNNFNILTKRFNPFISQGQQVRLGFIDFYFFNSIDGQVSVDIFIDEDSSNPITTPPSGFISTVQVSIINITNAVQAVITVSTPTLFRPGDNIYILGVAGMIQINGLTAEVVSSTTTTVTVNINSTTFGAYVGVTGTLYNLNTTSSNVVNMYPESTYSSSPDKPPFAQQMLWKRFYVTDISQLFQVQISLSNIQMLVDDFANSEMELHGMILWFSQAGRIINV